MMMVKRGTRRHGRKAAARVAGALAISVAAVSPQAATAVVPTTATGAWGLLPGSAVGNPTGTTPGTMLVGDSLVAWGNPQGHADMLRLFTGKSSAVMSTPGSSYSHWIRPNLMQPAGMAAINSYVEFFKPQLTVIALGTNDARLLREDPKYTAADVTASIRWATAVARQRSKCVILVNTHTKAAFSNKIPTVNSSINTVAASYTDKSVRVANWSAKISGKTWYLADNIHHNATGSAEYRSFIASSAKSALETAPCK